MENKSKDFLELYSDSNYEKPSVTVDAVIFRLINKENDNYRKLPEKQLQVFLTKRDFSPFQNVYGIQGTFIDLNSELTETMKLCVKKKVNLSNFYSEQLFTFGEKARDPRTRVLSVSYLLLTNESEKLSNGEWFDIIVNEDKIENIQQKDGFNIKKNINITLKSNKLALENTINVNIKKKNLQEIKIISIKKNSLAFDHIKLIFYALERLKNKIEWTDIIFNLLPKKFTLTELQQSFETILGQKLLDANFRRKILKQVSPLDELKRGKGHRASQLFTLKLYSSKIDIG